MDTGEPISYTAEPNTSHGAIGCPFVLKLLICFLFADGIERIVDLILWYQAQGDAQSLAPSPYYPNIPANILWILVHFLLGALLLLGTWWGRVWTQGIFVIHILFLGHILAVRNPEIWLYLETPARLRLLLTLILDMVIVAYLASPQARKFLSR